MRVADSTLHPVHGVMVIRRRDEPQQDDLFQKYRVNSRRSVAQHSS